MLLVGGKYIQLLNFKKKNVFFHQKTPLLVVIDGKFYAVYHVNQKEVMRYEL